MGVKVEARSVVKVQISNTVQTRTMTGGQTTGTRGARMVGVQIREVKGDFPMVVTIEIKMLTKTPRLLRKLIRTQIKAQMRHLVFIKCEVQISLLVRCRVL